MYKVKSYFTKVLDGNLSYHINDQRITVLNNRQNLAKKYNFNINNLRSMHQVHKDDIKIVNNSSEYIIENCDALITNEKKLVLLVLVADCIPILIKDETKGIVAAVHAGRASTFLNITVKTIEKMISIFDCDIKNIEVEFGPSIQKCCYEVNDEIRDFVENKYGKEFIFSKNISLQDINKKLLEDFGITKIKISNICTKCSGNDYFSYRKNNNTGRFAALIFIE